MGLSITFRGITELQNKIDNYTKQFPQKMEAFLQRLMEAGIPVVDTNMMTAMGDSSPVHTTWVEVQNDGSTITATLWVSGEDLAFIEFGAGIFYNHDEHPKASEFGVGIGTYGKGQGLNYGWYYYDDAGEKKFSRGTEMTMPVFKAGQEMLNRFDEIVRESFEF